MSSPSPSKPLASKLCSNSCSFYSSANSRGLCSLCYKKFLQDNPAEAEAVAAVEKAEARQVEKELEAATEKMDQELELKEEAEGVTKEEEAKKSPPKKTRCVTCRKKVGLTFFACRCGGVFCSLHRYSDKHQCAFDYNALARAEIAKNNPVIEGAKLNKI